MRRKTLNVFAEIFFFDRGKVCPVWDLNRGPCRRQGKMTKIQKKVGENRQLLFRIFQNIHLARLRRAKRALRAPAPPRSNFSGGFRKIFREKISHWAGWAH